MDTRNVPHDQIAAFCRRHGILRLAFFGSFVGTLFGPDSDIDVLVEFEPTAIVGYRIIGMEDELAQIMGGRKIDLVTFRSLSRWIRDEVLASAITEYAA